MAHNITSVVHTLSDEYFFCLQINYTGSSGGMEVAAALDLWSRSILEWNSRYTTVLADGDAKTFLELQEAEVYGPDIQITKEESINHVAKRMT